MTEITKLKNQEKISREHNHFPDGKTGYIPQSAGINPYSKQGKTVFYK